MSSFSDPVIISCSISGVIANRDQCPAIPYTPEEYAAEARRAVDEGASMIHIHARRPDGTPSYDVEDFRAITEAITAEVDVIVNYSTGAIGVPVEQRIAYLRALRPDVAALKPGFSCGSRSMTRVYVIAAGAPRLVCSGAPSLMTQTWKGKAYAVL